jgi:UDP-N-acetylmuramoylalanine--D-glutamate ligase
MGEMAEDINSAIPKTFTGERITGLKDMRQMVIKASEISERGDVVLLSPACASFGLFDNYRDRGNQFKEAVNML